MWGVLYVWGGVDMRGGLCCCGIQMLHTSACSTHHTSPTSSPSHSTTLRVIRDAINTLSPPPLVVAEGANTMDNARIMLQPVDAPRLRLDAGTWGTMGVGLGYCIAAAVADPSRLVVAVEGDSAFGFSGMEVETLVRYVGVG